jgi:hypothetical protein
MKKGLLAIVADKIRGVFRQALSPTFLVILVISVMLWYASKLSKDYTTDIPMNISIDGQKYRLTATVKGRGSTILAQRLSLKRRLSFTLDELSSRRSRETPGAYTITPASLKRAIGEKISDDLEITGVIDAPEFIPAAEEGEQEAHE